MPGPKRPRDDLIYPGQNPLNKVLARASKAPQPPESFDEEHVFRLFASFSGDVERTAHAAGLMAEDVVQLAESHGWLKRISVLLKLQKSGRPGDAERGVNRSLNFVQADRFRQFLERFLRGVCALSDDELARYCMASEVDKSGTQIFRLHTRPFADLASAMEKCHAMTYAALSDTATDRKERNEDPDADHTVGGLHMAIANAMAQIRTGNDKATALDDSKRELAEPSVDNVLSQSEPTG